MLTVRDPWYVLEPPKHADANTQARRSVGAVAAAARPLQSVAVCKLVTRYQKTVFTSFLVFLPAGAAAAIWFQLMRASSSAVVVGGEITILVIALAINQAALIVPLRRRFAAAVERQDAEAVDAVLDEVAAMWPRNPKMRAFVDANRAVALMFRERWNEAVAQARSALADPMARTQEALLLNNLAW